VIDRGGFGGLIHNISRLLPQLRLGNITGESVRLTEDDRAKFDNLLQLMRTQLQKSQLLDILEILHVNRGQMGIEFDQLKSQDTQEFRKKQTIKQKLREAESLHKQASGFQPGKGMLLKLLKPSKKKRAKKAQSKPRQSSREPKKKEVLKHEPVGPFEL